MPRDLIIVVAGSEIDIPDARILSKEIERQGLSTWFLEDSTKVGDSLLVAIESAVQQAAALILVRTGGADYEPWAALQQKAFQIASRFDNAFRILILPRGRLILAPSLLSQSILLLPDLDPRNAATFCVKTLKGGLDKGAPEILSHNDISPNAAPLIAPGIWTQAKLFEHTYPKYAETVCSLAMLDEYEAANAMYWKILYHSGYREYWKQRFNLTNSLIDLSKRNRDLYNTGMLLLKGHAYSFIENSQFRPAVNSIRAAHRFFVDCRSDRGQALCWDYLGELYLRLGDQSRALRAYDRAISELRGLERDQIDLKKRFIFAVNDHLLSRNRETELNRLQDEFAAICSYRTGLVAIESARGLEARGAFPEALVEAQAAVSFFRDKVGMPRNLAKATRLIASLKNRE